jgi:hypothetical protein
MATNLPYCLLRSHSVPQRPRQVLGNNLSFIICFNSRYGASLRRVKTKVQVLGNNLVYYLSPQLRFLLAERLTKGLPASGWRRTARAFVVKMHQVRFSPYVCLRFIISSRVFEAPNCCLLLACGMLTFLF